jgi:hypothetical protein
MGWNDKRQRAPVAIAALLAGALAGAGIVFGRGETVAARGKPIEAPLVQPLVGPVGTMRADVAIRQQQFRADGQPARAEAPPLALRLDRRQSSGRWTITLTYLATPAPTARTPRGLVPLDNPFAVSRVEIDEETGSARVFDRLGRHIAPPDQSRIRRFNQPTNPGGPGWDRTAFAQALTVVNGRSRGGPVASGLLAAHADRATRVRDLQARLGRPVGRMRGLDRFVSRDGDETRELLVDPGSVLPVEVNVARRGALASRLEMSYLAHGTGHVRSALRSELVVGQGAAGDRLVTEMTLGNIALGAGGVQ